jgi:bifunctional non-homologous end joining protein LigD
VRESAQLARARVEIFSRNRGYKIAHRGIRVEPPLLAEIEYRARSAEGKVWH